MCVLLLFSRSMCPTLCDPMDCSMPVFPVHGDSPGKNTGVGCHALLLGNLSDPGFEPTSPALAVRFFTTEPRKPRFLKSSKSYSVPNTKIPSISHSTLSNTKEVHIFQKFTLIRNHITLFLLSEEEDLGSSFASNF